MRVALIGYRGTGKSTVAELVADALGWAWHDTDVEIEQQAGRTIREIFAAEGETGFRDREARVVAELAAREACVLALGGGAVLGEANRRALRGAVVFWLTAPPEVLHARITADRQTADRRPALAGGGLQEIETLLAERTLLYDACADHSIDTCGKSARAVAEEIVATIRRRLQADPDAGPQGPAGASSA